MMSNALIAFFLAAGVSGFMYNKMSQTTGGGRTNDVVVVVGIIGLITFLFVLFILKTVIPN
jgi:hypothetical protein